MLHSSFSILAFFFSPSDVSKKTFYLLAVCVKQDSNDRTHTNHERQTRREEKNTFLSLATKDATYVKAYLGRIILLFIDRERYFRARL